MAAMTFRLAPVAAAIFFCTHVHAAGLGELQLDSALGEPLAATINVVSPEGLSEEAVNVDVLSPRAAGELGIQLVGSAYQYRLTPRFEQGRVSVAVATRRPVKEPYLNFVVRLKWPTGSVLKEYTVLLDMPSAVAPPATQSADTVRADTVRESTPQVRNTPRPVAAATEPAAKGVRVVVGDSLSRIAARLAASEGVSASPQVIAAWLLANNPRAFIRGNPNLIKAGSWLDLPAQGEWPTAMPVASPTVPQAPPGKAVGVDSAGEKADEAVAQSSGEPVLTISEVESQSDASVSPEVALRAQLDATRETIDMLSRENRDLKRRLDKLENATYLTSAEQLLQLKDQQIAALQARLSQVESDREAVAISDVTPEAVNSGLVVDSNLVEAAEPAEDSADPYAALKKLVLGLALGVSLIGLVVLLRSRSPASKPPEFAARWRPDDEVRGEIESKMSHYEPSFSHDEHGYAHGHDLIEERIAEALSLASKGSYELAAALLSRVQAEVGLDERVEDALMFILKMQDDRRSA